ncbi:MFS transporter [Streptomyces sp. NPDC058653]|uniref:MFS transporter n=1 Tax=Streptomyces sp. NPDC058653 TaxID=3346576 RepID=UPI00365EF629
MNAAARRRRPLTAVLTANAISAMGRTLSLIGIPWFVLQTTGSAGRAGAPRFAVAGLTDSTTALAVVMAGAGLAGGMINPILTTVTYERVPDGLRSRVAGAMTAGCELTMPLGALTAGLLVETTGLSAALLLMGGVYLLATLSPALLPAWRGLDAPGPAEAEDVSSSGPCGPVPAPAGTTPRPSAS